VEIHGTFSTGATPPIPRTGSLRASSRILELESIIRYANEYLGVATHPDYPGALNGLQVEGRGEVRHVCAAVDASEAAIDQAVRLGADLLIVHHGIFWEGQRPITGRRYRKLARILQGGLNLYSVHLPLDSHPEVGNCALLARALGIEIRGPFGLSHGVHIGWWGAVDCDRDQLHTTLERVVAGPVRMIAGGPDQIRTVGVVTGGAGSLIGEAVKAGLDAYVTGEGSHHTYVEAMEDHLNLYYAGHYATETFGVKALAQHLAASFGLTWEFIDLPSGM
jgi:dinuclear metal center YbgI/SA1388 family protein